MLLRPLPYFLLVSAVIADALDGSAQQPLVAPGENSATFDADFDDFVERLLQYWHVPGLSIAVIDHGKIKSKVSLPPTISQHFLFQGYGYAVLPDQNATADTQWFTGSTTKAFTAAAVAQLIHDGKHPDLKWTSPINEYIRSDFVLENEYSTTHTTVEDALSHRSGLPRHDLIYGRPHDTPSTIVQRIRYLPLTAEPRTTWQYCNLMYVVVTDLIERLTGADLESVLRENFWKPLGMSSTTFTLPKESERSRLARGYWWHSNRQSDVAASDNGEFIPEAYIDLLPISGAGATISTVNDYSLWIKAWLDATDENDSRNASSPVTNRIVRDLSTPRAIVLPDLDDEWAAELNTPPLYGLGWETADILGEKIMTHSGGLTGFGTQIYLLPNKQYGIVTMGNTAGSSNYVGLRLGWKLIFEKIAGRGEVHATTISMVPERLARMSETSCGLPELRWNPKLGPSTLAKTNREDPNLQLNQLAGLYSNPGYGNLNLTISTPQPKGSSQAESILEGGFYDRMWPLKIHFQRLVNTHFSTKLSDPHGLGDILSGDGIVWQEIGESEAVFEVGLDGKTVERVGVVLDGDMAEKAWEKGEKYWRDSMIWFERL